MARTIRAAVATVLALAGGGACAATLRADGDLAQCLLAAAAALLVILADLATTAGAARTRRPSGRALSPGVHPTAVPRSRRVGPLAPLSRRYSDVAPMSP